MKAYINEKVKQGDLLRVVDIQYGIGTAPAVILERVNCPADGEEDE